MKKKTNEILFGVLATIVAGIFFFMLFYTIATAPRPDTGEACKIAEAAGKSYKTLKDSFVKGMNETTNPPTDSNR